MRWRRLSLAACLIVAGCETTTPPPPLTAPFDAGALAFIHTPGTASIEGQAFARQRGGGVVTAAGEEIILIPATDFTRQLTERMQAGAPSADDAAKVKTFQRTTVADADGRFKFTGLAPGSYIVLVTIRWMAGDYAQGGGMKQEVAVTSGQAASIIMAM